MKKNIIRIIIAIYIVIAVFTTVNLLMYNDHNITEWNGKEFVKLSSDIGNYKKGNLLIIKKSDNYEANDNVFYCKIEKEDCIITYGTVETTMSGSPLIDNETVSEKLIIGKDENIKVVPVLGNIMNVFESKWGYLCLIVLPMLVIFIYETFVIAKEVNKKK